jgi:hypothetical protein
MVKRSTAKPEESESGKLRIDDDWNAIPIIALSQSNPLKAIAEFSRTASMRTPRPLLSRVAASTESTI